MPLKLSLSKVLVGNHCYCVGGLQQAMLVAVWGVGKGLYVSVDEASQTCLPLHSLNTLSLSISSASCMTQLYTVLACNAVELTPAEDKITAAVLSLD